MTPVSLLAAETQPQPPLHVAIIMDGNGRWAHQQGLPRTAGHRRGADSVRTVVEAAAEMGVSYLTLFGFSSENWKRPPAEITDLMGLLRLYLRNELKFLADSGVRLRVIGDRERLAPDIVDLIEHAEQRTSAGQRMTLIIALSYGGRGEIAAAARAMAAKAVAGDIDVANIDEDALASHLFTVDLPDPDLLIRTSGEQRISNFLLWQMAYTEFLFVDTLWPDFGREAFEEAVKAFHGRDRRYGAAVG
jgi:undecaprenyl diphosphate synthase